MDLARTTRLLDDQRARAHRELRSCAAAALRRGMSQREAARQMARTQPEVNRLARHSAARDARGERRRWMTARDAREAAAVELRRGDLAQAVRLVIQAADHLSQLDDPRDVEEWATTPLHIADPRVDTLLSALAARGLVRHGAQLPTWAHPEPLETPWYPGELSSQRRRADREAPADLRRLGIMLSERDLTTA